MKNLLSICLTALILIAATPPAKARESVSLDVFYDNLEPYGSWLEVGDYGYVWQPRDVDPDWRPYSDGRWVYTDAGWTWNSDEPYGWAVYHYGRWANIDQIGWVWVPGTEWGPAWVSWRHSPKYVGWAPLPPEAEFREDTGFSDWVDDYYDIGPDNYRFVEVRNLGAPRLRTVFVNRTENITIIQQTTNITHITYQNNVVFNGGIGYDEVSRFSAEPIRRLKLERREQFDGDPRHLSGDRLRARIEGNALSVIALPFLRSAVAPKNVGRRVERVDVNHGWRNAGPAAEIAAVRAKVKSESRPPATLPSRPKFDRPIGRDGADVRRPGDRPERGNDLPGNSKMRGDDIARLQINPPAAEAKPGDNASKTSLPNGDKRGPDRSPGAPPEGSPDATNRPGRGKMTDNPAERPGDATPRGNNPRSPDGTPPGPKNDGEKGVPKGAPQARPADEPKGNNPRSPDGTPPGPKDDGNKGKMKEVPRARPADETEGSKPRRPGGAPADIPGREEKSKMNDPQRPPSVDNAESSSVRKPGLVSKPAEPPVREPRKPESDMPKGKGPDQPKRADIEPSKPRPGVPQPREPKVPSAEPMTRSKPAEAAGREPKKEGAGRPQGSPNNSQQEKGRGNPGGKEKKKPEDNAR